MDGWIYIYREREREKEREKERQEEGSPELNEIFEQLADDVLALRSAQQRRGEKKRGEGRVRWVLIGRSDHM